jgi:hypothetical protein
MCFKALSHGMPIGTSMQGPWATKNPPKWVFCEKAYGIRHHERRWRTKANNPIKLAIKIMAHSDNVGIGAAADAAGTTYVNNVFSALMPVSVVTTTLAVPGVPWCRGGVVQVAVVLLITVNAVQATPPTVMLVAPVRLLPVRVIGVPPKVVPLAGEIAVIVGAPTPCAWPTVR